MDTDYPRGPELLRQVVNHILANPETWDQTRWHCGTTHCVGGFCQIMGGREECEETTNEDARELLGISDADAGWLFASHRTLPEIYSYAQALIAGCDRDGYDRDGHKLPMPPL